DADGDGEFGDRALEADAVDVVERGAIQTLTGTGFEPGEEVRAEVQSDVWEVSNTETANDEGTVEFRFRVPTDFPLGNHTGFVFSTEEQYEGAGEGIEYASDGFEVVEAGELPDTGSGNALLITFGAILAAAGGAAIFAVNRRRGMAQQ
uniref:LPXTG cell wall anchor domain-containing protein n=1 Tax=Phytoactinopolyspora endophytica TaxID=1642495 RepID=UPI00101D2555